jgi:cysteine desulfurase
MSHHSRQIYLDHSATTPLDERVKKVIDDHFTATFGNASSVHLAGRTAKVVLEESREALARSIHAEPAEIFFTSGGTESDNQAIAGVAFAHRRETQKDHIIVSAIEHHAVLDCCEYLKGLGFSISLLPVSSQGVVDCEALERMITPRTCLIAVMHANNETGILQPVEQVATIGAEHDVTVHSDAVQTFGKIPIDVRALGVPLLSFSAHKLYGPKGIGAIYIKKGTKIDALLHGGSQERKNRPGTENVPLIAGFAAAAGNAVAELEKESVRIAALRNLLISRIEQRLEGVVFNSISGKALPHIVNVSLDAQRYDIEGESLLLNMDLAGVAVSSGSACTSGSVQPSHVLLAMGRDKRTTQATVRFSFGKQNTAEEVARAADIFCDIATKFKIPNSH